MLSGQTLVGKILRLPLFLIPREAEVRILRGPLRGKKWIVGDFGPCNLAASDIPQLAYSSLSGLRRFSER
jgi:hypothetical protein